MAFAGILDRLDAKGEATAFKLYLEAGLHGPAQTFDASDLVRLACLAGQRFREIGVSRGDRIVSILSTGRPLLQTILGAWAAGGVISVLAPSIESGRSSLSLDRLGRMLSKITPRVIVTDEATRSQILPLVSGYECRIITSVELPIDGAAPAGRVSNAAEDLAFIQFTSGSTGDPKAIAIEHGQLILNVEESAERFEFVSGSVMVSWLPLHHDLGFVTALMMPLAVKNTLILLPTDAFMRAPLSWLAAVSDHRATHTLAPPFACQMLSRSSFLKRAQNLELECLRFLGVGSEPVPWTVVQEFEEAYAGHGLRPGAVRAGFGMAEATLLVTCSGPFDPRRLVWIDRQTFRTSGSIKLAAPRSSESMPLLSNGLPIASMQIKIVDETGNDVGQGQQGRVLISGSSVTKRYFGTEETPQTHGWLDTGDLGFVLKGELFISGRSKDVIIRGGVNVNAHEVEEAVLASFPGVVQRAAAFSLPRAGDPRDEVLIAVEIKDLPPPETFAMEVARIVQRDIGLQIDRVVSLPRGAIPRTTSGKIQRSRVRELYRSGTLVPESKTL